MHRWTLRSLPGGGIVFGMLFLLMPATVGAEAGKTIQDCPDCPQLTVIPSGSFTMGSPGAEEGARTNEGPQRTVRIDYRLAVGTYEVSVGEFRAFATEAGHMATGCWSDDGTGTWEEDPAAGWWAPGYDQTERSPVVCVSWEDAQAYVAWLSEKTGKPYRLLSEAEWEYVARAGSEGRFHWGETVGREHANYGRTECCGHDTAGDGRFVHAAPVGSFPANAFGVHDMLGNVWEWVEDCWHESYARGPADGSAWIATGACSLRGVRGGSWYDIPDLIRAAYRHKDLVGSRVNVLGFRVARTYED